MGQGCWTPSPGKSQVVIGFLRNSVADHPWGAIGSKKLLLGGGPYGPLCNMLITKKRYQEPPDGIIWIRACMNCDGSAVSLRLCIEKF